MAFQPAITRSYNLPEEVQSTFALDLLTQIATSLSAVDFTQSMVRIFGETIPDRVYCALQERLIAGDIENPAILIEDSDYLADYDNRERLIRIHSSVIENVVRNVRIAEFLNILLHEFGHHIDNVLRHDFGDYLDDESTPLAEDAPGEEGARFSYWMALLGKFDSTYIRIATLQYLPQEPELNITANWESAHKTIIKRYDAGLSNAGHYHGHADREAFEAGDGDDGHMTHMEIEEVLSRSSFSEQERKAVYFGNWLRDYSQVVDPKIVRAADTPKDFPDVLSREALTKIVDILSIKRFGDMRVSAPELFTVTPEILGVYRPSEHIDNPKSTDSNAPDPTTRDMDFEPKVLEGDPLLEVDYETSMKRYIARSVDFMERELQTTLKKTFSPGGLRAFGSALHVLEDFFAHSNFVELALIKNGYSQVLPWTSPADCKAGLPLVTGMFGSTDVLGSLLGPLGKILFSTDDVTYMPLKPGDRSPREQLLLILLQEHHNPLYLKKFEEFLSARDAWVGLPFAEFLQRCAAYLQGAAAVPGNAVAVVMKDVLTLFGNHVGDWQTRYGQDPHGNGSTDPTHSQLAKDHAEHPLHLLAASLAAHAVRHVGDAMAAYWAGDVEADPVAVAKSYFAHPQDTDWQDAMVATWAAENSQEVQRSTSTTELLELRKQLAETGSNTLEQMRKDSIAYLNFMRGEFLDKDSPLWALFTLSPGGTTIKTLLQLLRIIK